MNRHESSLDDIKITLTLEPRHFAALSGQALNYIELKNMRRRLKVIKQLKKYIPY